ncbi:MAG: hypothetical protein LBR56_08970, partial [Sporomusaceae bacterium]|nr:hypothetical protein [Sporomusaceae bacterium]
MEQKTLQPKKSMIQLISLSALAVLLILTASTLFFWRNIAAQTKVYAHNALTAQITSYLGEKISFAEISFSPTGQVTLTEVKVYSKNGLLLAKLPQVEVYYNWHWRQFSLEKFSFKDLAYIERLSLKESEFFVRKEDTQFDLMPILKVQADGAPSGFAGLLELEAAKIDLTRAWSFDTDVVIEGVTGTIDFTNPLDITIDLE